VSEPRGSSANGDRDDDAPADASFAGAEPEQGRLLDLERRLASTPDSPLFFELARIY